MSAEVFLETGLYHIFTLIAEALCLDIGLFYKSRLNNLSIYCNNKFDSLNEQKICIQK